MRFFSELSLYQAKLLTTQMSVVELQKSFSSCADPVRKAALERQLAGQDAFVRAFDGMVIFLNCCIELERGKRVELEQDAAPKRQA